MMTRDELVQELQAQQDAYQRHMDDAKACLGAMQAFKYLIDRLDAEQKSAESGDAPVP